jgi:hypothetical protein
MERTDAVLLRRKRATLSIPGDLYRDPIWKPIGSDGYGKIGTLPCSLVFSVIEAF